MCHKLRKKSVIFHEYSHRKLKAQVPNVFLHKSGQINHMSGG